MTESNQASVTTVIGNGGLPKICVVNALATAEIYLHGATVTHFQPAGQSPVLFLSGASKFDHAKAIRGGVPICWPWFGPHPTDPKLPQHGTARTKEWSFSAAVTQADGSTSVTLTLETESAGLAYEVTVGRSLATKLTTTNRSPTPLTITQALHSYLVVGDVRQISLHGLAGVEYFNRVTQSRSREGNEDLRFAGEFDRTYLNTTSPVTVTDPVLKRRLTVSKQGSASTVVWNPWIDKTKSLADMADDEWPGFICVETANAPGNEVTIAPGESSTMQATVEVC